MFIKWSFLPIYSFQGGKKFLSRRSMKVKTSLFSSTEEIREISSDIVFRNCPIFKVNLWQYTKKEGVEEEKGYECMSCYQKQYEFLANKMY